MPNWSGVSGGGILNADMATVGRAARAGVSWWFQELRAIVPARSRRWLTPQTPVVAHYDGTAVVLTRRGRAAAHRPGLPVALTVPAAGALVRTVELPALGTADLRRLVAVEAERLLPFAADSALVDFEVGPRGDDSRQPITLAALPVDTADAALAAAGELDVRALGLAAPSGRRFDFMPEWRRIKALRVSSARQIWWALTAFAFVLNLATLIGREVYALRQMAALVETHGETAATARKLRARVFAEDRRRRDWLQRRRRHDPLPVLAAVTALPDGVWVHRLAWDGTQLRIAGFKPASVDVIGALRRSPLFSAARNGGTEVAATTTTGQPFDVTADRR